MRGDATDEDEEPTLWSPTSGGRGWRDDDDEITVSTPTGSPMAEGQIDGDTFSEFSVGDLPVLRALGVATRRRPGAQAVGEDPYWAILIVPYSFPRQWMGTSEELRRLTLFWARQLRYWDERRLYDGVQWTGDGILVDGEVYWNLRDDSYLWEWDVEEAWIGGYVDPRRIGWWRRAQILLGEDREGWPVQEYDDYSNIMLE